MGIYTKTGDGGTTSLIGGRRVSKGHPRVEAYGSVDELMANVAYLRDNMQDMRFESRRGELLAVLKCLMTVSAVFADEDETPKVKPLSEGDIVFLEEKIDEMDAALPAVFRFTLPGGHPLVSLSHIARTVCRRAERSAARVECGTASHVSAMRYLNRLSDYLYLLGRKVALDLGVKETLWEP